jgi:hypothetical protein
MIAHSGSGLAICTSRSGKTSRANRIRLNGLVESKEFNTENTEHHGVSRRFFGSDPSASIRLMKLIIADVNARTAPGPGSPCNSVVLRVLRVKFFPSEPRMPSCDLTRNDAATPGHRNSASLPARMFPVRQPIHGRRP